MNSKNEQHQVEESRRKKRLNREEKLVESIFEDMHYEGHKDYKPNWSYLKMSWTDLLKFVANK